MDHQLASFIDDLKATHRENLIAVVLYGQAAAGVAPAVAGQDLLIALETLTPRDLRNAHAAIREWQRLGHPVPVFFTVSEIENSADVFPIEFRQMVRAHKVLYGRDVLAGVDVSDRNLRHQVEYELRSRLLLLRRQYVPASVSAEGLMTLMADSIVSFAAPLQGLLMLKGLEPPAEKHAAVALAVEHLGLDGATLERIINIHQDNLQESLSETEANRLFGEYLRQVERIIDAVDSIEEV